MQPRFPFAALNINGFHALHNHQCFCRLQHKSRQAGLFDRQFAASLEAVVSGASNAFDLFINTFEAKHSAAVECLQKDRDGLLTYYNFPAENWCHIRTTNAIESTFATIRVRHRKTKIAAVRERHS